MPSKRFVIGYLVFTAVVILVAWKSGSFEISEICLVDGVGCPTN